MAPHAKMTPRTRRARVRACADATLETSMLLARLARGEVRRRLPGSLHVLDVRALAYIDRHPACGPSEVGAYLGLSAPAATKLVDPLVARKLLTRATAVDDRRRRVLALTPLGRERLHDARLVTRAFVEQRLAPVGDAQLEEVQRVMQTLHRLFAPEAAE